MFKSDGIAKQYFTEPFKIITMYSEDLKQTLIKNPRFQNVYFNEKDETQYIFHPNANFRKVVSRDAILKVQAPKVETTEDTTIENETKKTKKK